MHVVQAGLVYQLKGLSNLTHFDSGVGIPARNPPARTSLGSPPWRCDRPRSIGTAVYEALNGVYVRLKRPSTMG